MDRVQSYPHFSGIASWHEGDKVQNVHQGSSRKMDAEEALQKARKMKAEALGAPRRVDADPLPID